MRFGTNRNLLSSCCPKVSGANCAPNDTTNMRTHEKKRHAVDICCPIFDANDAVSSCLGVSRRPSHFYYPCRSCYYTLRK